MLQFVDVEIGIVIDALIVEVDVGVVGVVLVVIIVVGDIDVDVMAIVVDVMATTFVFSNSYNLLLPIDA